MISRFTSFQETMTKNTFTANQMNQGYNFAVNVATRSKGWISAAPIES